MRLIADSHDGCVLSQIAEKLDLNPQTAQSIIRTLQYHGLVFQEAKGLPYRTGSSLLLLARPLLMPGNKLSQAREIINEFARQTGEYVIYDALTNDDIITYAEARGNQPLTVASEYLRRERLHLMATGKILLAFCPEDIRKQWLDQIDFAREAGPKAAHNRRQLVAQLEQVRQDGFIACEEEIAPGIVALAVPVCDRATNKVAAIGISLPSLRYSATVKKELQGQLKEIAEKLSFLTINS